MSPEQQTRQLRETFVRIAAESPQSTPSSDGVMWWAERWREVKVMKCCPHAQPNGTALVGILTLPGVLTAHCSCFGRLVQEFMGGDDSRCDDCGQIRQTFHEVLLGAGPTVTLFGHVCDQCHDRDVPPS